MLENNLEKIAKKIRLRVLKTAMKNGGRGSHLGGTFSCIDLLVCIYYSNLLNFKAKDPKWKDRDRVLIGKGHAHLALYHIWSDLNILSKKILNSYGKNGSLLGQQLNYNTPGSEYNTGSLGHVVGIGTGICLGARLNKKKYKTYAIVGDAECDEGAIWEAAMFAGKNHLNSLVTIVDKNNLSVMDVIEDENISNNLKDKFKACDWHVEEIDGHSISEILSALRSDENQEKPKVIIANTIKGKGVSFMENEIFWHSGVPTKEQFYKALKELKN
jgi:transketolase